MPNWCTNKVEITGPTDDIKRFRRQANGRTQSYNEFSPHSGNAWPIHDDIRLDSLVSTPPELGDAVAFSFHSLYPVPEDFRCFPYDDASAVELGELVGIERPYGGYRWEGIHWGCKWGACDSELVKEEDTYLHYEFNTPWGPAIDFFDRVSQDWPNLTFDLSYDEPGMGFRGEATWEEGSLVSEHSHEYNWEEEQEDE